MTYSEIEKQFSELSDRIDTLQALYEQINNFVIQHFVLFWAIIVGVFAIIGVALYFIAKSVAQKGVDKAIKDFSMRIEQLERKTSDLSIAISQKKHTPQIFDLPLSSDYSAIPSRGCNYCKSADLLVIVTIAVEANHNCIPHVGQIIAVLPSGFRPSVTIHVDSGEYGFRITTDGYISLYGSLKNDRIFTSPPICFFSDT